MLRQSAHMQVGERIAKARNAKKPGGWSQSDLATELASRGMLGFNRDQWLSRIKNYESGRTTPPTLAERAIEEALELEPGWLSSVTETVRWRQPQSNVEFVSPTQSKTINLVPYWGIVPCGDWERPEVGHEELIQVSDRIEDTRGCRAVRVAGNSMLPLFTPGEVVTIRLSSDKLDGVVTLAQNQDGELSLKLMRYVNGTWELHSLNPDYGIATADSVTILGHAIYHEGGDFSGIRA